VAVRNGHGGAFTARAAHGKPLCEGACLIIAAAEAVFAERGYEGTTIQAVARKAKTSQANVIYHFKTKKNLYVAALRAADETLGHAFDALARAKQGGVEAIAQFAYTHLDMLLRHEKIARLLLREIYGYGPLETKELHEKVIGGNFQKLVAALAGGVKKGHVRAGVDPAALAVLLLGANGIFMQTRRLMAHSTLEHFSNAPRQYHEKIMDVLLHGILPRRGASKRLVKGSRT